jgi:hypothetical protein
LAAVVCACHAFPAVATTKIAAIKTMHLKIDPKLIPSPDLKVLT